jgi:hypothetical protein
MGRFCGIDPSLIDEILEDAKEKTQKRNFKRKEDEESTTIKEGNAGKDVIEEERADGVGNKR